MAKKKASKRSTKTKRTKKRAAKAEPLIDEPSSLSVSDQIDREDLRRAFEKRQRGEKLSVRDRAAIKRFEDEDEERRRWEYYAKIPKRHWKTMAGEPGLPMHDRQLDDQARRYEIPFTGAEIDLPKVVYALHRFLAKNARKLAGTDDADASIAGAASPGLEHFRQERAQLAELKRKQVEGELMPRETVHDILTRLAEMLRRTADRIQKSHGREAYELIAETVQEWERQIDEQFGDNGQAENA